MQGLFRLMAAGALSIALWPGVTRAQAPAPAASDAQQAASSKDSASGGKKDAPQDSAAKGSAVKGPAPGDPPADKPAEKAPDASADENAFPEEQSLAAQKAATQQEQADRKAASAGAAGDPVAGSSSRDKLAGVDILGERDSRISNGAGGTIIDPKLSAKDLEVGRQYYALGNYQGAYERLKEATIVNPANLEAVFYLAEAARRSAHLDESAENYRLYLQAQPDGAKAKQARKALAQLSPQ